MTMCRNGGHEIRGPQDRRSNGHCKRCAQQNERRYHRSLVDARRKLRQLEAVMTASPSPQMSVANQPRVMA